MRKLIFSLIVAVISAIGISAYGATTELYLTLTFKDGTEKSYPAEGIKITYEGDYMVIVSEGVTYQVLKADLDKMKFTTEPTGITSVKAGNSLTVENGVLTINVTKASTLKIYSTDGTEVLSRKVNAGETTVGIPQIPAGVYVVKVNNQTFKISI